MGHRGQRRRQFKTLPAWGGAEGTVYVADTGTTASSASDADGAFLGSWGSTGSENGQFKGPYAVAVGPDGTVYVADWGNARIQRFSATGAFLDKWQHGQGAGQFAFPGNVAAGPDGTIYVADGNNGHIQRFSAAGTSIDMWGTYGFGDGQFFTPYNVAVGPDGPAYVTDCNTDRLQAFRPAYPALWRAEFFANRWLVDRPLAITQADIIHFDWGMSAPDPALPADGFSARFQRYVPLTSGFYLFTIQADDGVRLWVDGHLLVDRWDGPAGTWYAGITLAAGDHPVQLSKRRQRDGRPQPIVDAPV